MTQRTPPPSAPNTPPRLNGGMEARVGPQLLRSLPACPPEHLRFHHLVGAAAILCEERDYEHPHRTISPDTIASSAKSISLSPTWSLASPFGERYGPAALPDGPPVPLLTRESAGHNGREKRVFILFYLWCLGRGRGSRRKAVTARPKAPARGACPDGQKTASRALFPASAAYSLAMSSM